MMACMATLSCVLMMSLVIAIPTVSAIPLAATGQVYYVKPNDSYHCPHESCYTLAYYVANVTTYFTSNTTMIFLPGNHSLANGTVQIGNITDLTLIGNDSLIPGPYGLPPESSSRVECNGSGVFSFENITSLVIQNLTFLGCGGMTVLSLPKVTALYLHNIFDLTMSGVTVHNSSGYGLYGSNIHGNSNINGSTFAFNSGSHSYYGGNMELYYNNCLHIATSTVYIGYSKFLYGNNRKYGSGLDIAMQCTNVSITVDNVIMIGNKGYSGGNFVITFHNTSVTFTFPVIIKNCHIEGGVADVGAGMYISLTTDSSHFSYGEFFHISNTTFTNNHAWSVGGGIYMAHNVQQVFSNSSGTFVVENSTFYNNSKGRESHIGGAVVHTTNFRIPGYEHRSVPQLQLEFIKCNFSQNFDALHYASSAALFTNEETSVLIINSTFQNNNCTAVTAVNSNIIFSGNVTIAGNIGNNGGGLILCDDSFMYLKSNTTVLFSGNHAKHTGGAIYAAKDSCLQAKSGCFFQLDTQVQPQSLSSIFVVLENNSATIAGSAVYGGSIDYCYFFSTNWDIKQKPSSKVFNQIFHPNHSSSDASFISSDPVGVCFCDHNMTWQIDCNVTIYPGQTFSISVVVVGQRNGTVPGEVFATFQSATNRSSLKHYEYAQEINNTKCSLLNYTVFSILPQERLILRTQQTETYYLPPRVVVKLQQCPLGFTLTPSPYHCDCVDILAEHGVRCDVNGPGINREAPVWIGNELTKHNKSRILFHYHCPFDYCKPQDIVIATNNTSFNQDEQCAFNRKGILCGECKENLSLALGSSQCVPCSDVYLLLLLAFAVAGVALVVLIAVCNLIVTEGTINGLIFYANIIQINRATFFPPLPHNSFISGVFTVFISWINLDLGIQTCFYNGMDTYTKTWLQFAFPIYIWVIAGVIIILSRKYTVITRAIGRHAVQVLATLILLSFAKLLRTVIAALSYTSLTCPNDETCKTVWLSDGNIEYLKGKHIPLFMAAILAFLFLILPYTFLLVFIQCLYRLHFTWIAKLKPFIDAYTGPYKDQSRFWAGHQLLVRIILFGSITVNAGGNLIVDFLLTIAACFHLLLLSTWILRGVYKKWPLDVLESSFFLNLAILSAATAYLIGSGKYNPQAQASVTYTSVGIALFTFAGILSFHTYKQTKTSRTWKNLTTWLSQHERVLEPVILDGDHPVETDSNEDARAPLLPPPPPLAPYARFDQYREPVLGLDDDNST